MIHSSLALTAFQVFSLSRPTYLQFIHGKYCARVPCLFKLSLQILVHETAEKINKLFCCASSSLPEFRKPKAFYFVNAKTSCFSPFSSPLVRFSLVLLVFKNSTEILSTDYFYLSGFYESTGEARRKGGSFRPVNDVKSSFLQPTRNFHPLKSFADYLER